MSDQIFLDYIEDILDAMEKAEILLTDVSYAQLESDFRIHFAVTRALEIVGEATKRLPRSLRIQYPKIPWKAMAGMRDRLTHGYDQIDYEIIWDAVKREIPRIKPMIQKILQDHSDQP